MIEKLILQIQSVVVENGAKGVFLATLIEEVIAPIPSPLVPMAAGFFLLPAHLSLFEAAVQGALIVALPVTIGVTLGSLAVYCLGYFGGKPAIDKCKKWLGVNWKDIEKIENKLIRGYGDEVALFVLRVIPIVPGIAISGFCGIVRYPIKSFAIATILGSIVRALVLSIIGWCVGEMYAAYVDVILLFEKYALIIAIIFAGLLLSWFYGVKKRRRA